MSGSIPSSSPSGTSSQARLASYADLGVDLSSERLSRDTAHIREVFSHEPMMHGSIDELCRFLDADPKNRDLWQSVLDFAKHDDGEKTGDADSVDSRMLSGLLGDPPACDLDEWRRRCEDRIRLGVRMCAAGSFAPAFLSAKNGEFLNLTNLGKAFRSLYVAVRIKSFCHDILARRTDALRRRHRIPAGQPVSVEMRAGVPEFAKMSVGDLVRFFRGELSIVNAAGEIHQEGLDDMRRRRGPCSGE